MSDPPAKTTEFQQSNSSAHKATKPRDKQRLQQPARSNNYYGPNAAPTTEQHATCEGCSRKGHTPDNCTRKEHPNWNSEHTHVTFADTAEGRAIAREANGTYLSCLPPYGVVWDPISQQWGECTALQDWRRKIERARAKLAGRSVPPQQLYLTIGPHPNLPATHRGLTPKVSLYTKALSGAVQSATPQS